jgi:hypothetical protein
MQMSGIPIKKLRHLELMKRPLKMTWGMLSAVILFVSVSACAGARHDVHFDSAAYPISLTPSVPVKQAGDKTLRNLRPSEFAPMGRFHAEQVGKSLFWTWIPLNTVDFSREINEQVDALKADAIVNLRITVTETGFGKLGLFSPLHWFPFWPGDVKVILDGDIIRVRR